MYTTLPKFRKPISLGKEPSIELSYWDVAYDNFENKKFKDSVIGLLNYMNPLLLKGKDTSKDIELSQSHGSAEINIRITDNEFVINAPFLRIENSNKVALMRKVAEVNFTPLTLAQIVLKNDALWFEFSSPLELCQPYKMYYVIREICEFADQYDDEFIKKFGAAFYNPPKITYLTDSEKDKVWDHIQEIASDFNSYGPYFEQKRWSNAEWHLSAIVLLTVSNMPYIQGLFRTELSDIIYDHFYGRDDFYVRLNASKTYIKKLLSLSKEDFFKDVYYVEKLMNLKWRSSAQILQQAFEKHKERIMGHINNSRSFEAAYDLTVVFLEIMDSYNVEDAHKLLILNTLEQAGNKEEQQAVNILFPVFNMFLTGTFTPQTSAGFESIISGFISKFLK